jgi:putative phosphoribosyl transferase
MAAPLALFADRREAGRRLGRALARLALDAPLVVALPRGGVPVGFEVAKELAAPFDILLVRKLGAPFNPEYGIGAIAEGGLRFVRDGDVAAIGLSASELEAIVASESAELQRRMRAYRGDAEPHPVAGHAVVLVDDGIATGGTAVVAAETLRRRGAAEVVLAVPVGPADVDERLGGEFDEIVCLEQPPDFFGIGQFYADFGQVGDEEVTWLLAEAFSRPERRVEGQRSPPTRRDRQMAEHANDRSDPHRPLNNPVGEPDPTEWPDPYEKRPDPRDPADPDGQSFGKGPKRDKLDE